MACKLTVRRGLTERETAKLYGTFYRIRQMGISVAFDSFDEFCAWAKKAGYKDGLRLVRIRRNGPFSEDNCAWHKPAETEEEMAERWDAFITPIREHYKAELEQLEQEKARCRKTTVWQYEHPDIIRARRGNANV